MKRKRRWLVHRNPVFAGRSGTEKIGVHTGGDCAEDIFQVVKFPTELGIIGGNGDDAIKEPGEPSFPAKHPAVLEDEVGLGNNIGFTGRQAFPDLRLDIVLEEDGGSSELGVDGAEIGSWGKKIAYDEIKVSRGIKLGDLSTHGGRLVFGQCVGQGTEEEVE